MVRRSYRLEVAKAGFSGVIPFTDKATRRMFSIRCAVDGSPRGYNHIDGQPETKHDWDIIRSVTNNNPRDPRWPARSMTASARNGDIFGFGVFTYTHAPIIYRAAFNPRYINPDDAHICIHMFTSLGERPAGENNQYRRGHQACIEAEGATVQTITYTDVSYYVDVISGPVNIRTGAGTNFNPPVGSVRNPRRLQIDREQIGIDGSSHSLWGRITNDKEYSGRWIALRLTTMVAVAPVVPPPLVVEVPQGRIHVVENGDTLYNIGVRTGTRWQDIAHINGIHEPYTIFIGQVLRVA